MRNTLFWIALAVLSLQDLFKKQSPTKRQQQFLQTGETAQAFIEGTNIYSYTSIKKKLSYYFGKPDRDFKRSEVEWNIELTNGIVTVLLFKKSYNNISSSPKIELFYMPYDRESFMIKHQRVIPYYKQRFVIGDYNLYSYFFTRFLSYCFEATDSEDYKKLFDIANSGDWELALEIAKGQGLLNSQKIEGVSNGIVTCSGCGWEWEVSDGGNDPYVCHKCGHDNEKIEGVESSTTQRSNTIKSYKKVAEKIKVMFGNVSILDYGAGLGLGTQMMKEVTGNKVDSFEPYPVNWQSDFPVTYTDSSSIKKKYDIIVSLNVLNVLPEEIRNNAVKNIYKNLKKGGTAFISTRKWTGDVNSAKSFEKGPEYKSIIVLTRGQRVFQKGFDGNELVDYIYEVLGNSVDVVKSNFGANSIMLIK